MRNDVGRVDEGIAGMVKALHPLTVGCRPGVQPFARKPKCRDLMGSMGKEKVTTPNLHLFRSSSLSFPCFASFPFSSHLSF